MCRVQKRQRGKCNRCGQTFAYPPQHMPPLRLVQVQRAEMCRKTPGQVLWLTMAIAAGTLRTAPPYRKNNIRNAFYHNPI